MTIRGLLLLGLLAPCAEAQANAKAKVASEPTLACGVPSTTSDVTPPNVTISIKYHDNSGVRTTKLTADATVKAKWADGFTIQYDAYDKSGLKDVTLIPAWSAGTGSTTEPLVATHLVSGHCPKVSLSTDVTPTAQVYWYHATATDWNGNAGNSPKLTVIPLP